MNTFQRKESFVQSISEYLATDSEKELLKALEFSDCLPSYDKKIFSQAMVLKSLGKVAEAKRRLITFLRCLSYFEGFDLHK